MAISCPGGGTLNTTTCACECPASAPLCNGQCVPNTCPSGSGQVFNVECCNQGVNPCQNPGQPSGKCKA